MTRELVKVGRFCPNEVCPDHGKVDAGDIIRFCRTRNSTQRCRRCGQTFTETKVTFLYRRRTDSKDTLEALAWLLHNPVVTAPIIGPRTVEQLEDSARAPGIELSEGVLARLDEIWPGPGGEAPDVYIW